MPSLISAESTTLIWAAVLGIVAIGFWSESTPLGRRLSGVVVVLALSTLASNVGLLPKQAPVYDTAWNSVVPVAITLLLLKANLRRIIPETGSLLLLFILAGIATVIGVLVAASVVNLGDNMAKVSGIFSATYIGGSVNFAAVSEALVVKDAAILAAAVAADNVVGALYLIWLALIPALAFTRRYFRMTHASGTDPAASSEVKPKNSVLLNPLHISVALTIGFFVTVSGRYIADAFSVAHYGLVIVTLIALIIANLFPSLCARLQGEDVLGMILMYIFFASIGAGADVAAIVAFGPSIFLFALVIVTVHFLLLTAACYLLRLDYCEALIASNACIMGPATAAALAASQGWRSLVTPAILCGAIGYGVANFIAVGVARILC